MRTNHIKVKHFEDSGASSRRILLLVAVAAFAQQQVNLTAGPANLVLPDGSTTPMWGYSCGAAVAGSTATCAESNPARDRLVPRGDYGSHGTGPADQSHQQSVVSGPRPNRVPTSLVIVGQLGGGLGIARSGRSRPVRTTACAANRRGRIVDAGHRGHAAGARAARAVVLHGSGGGSDHATDLDGGQPAAGHVPDGVGHAPVHPGSHGPVRNGGGDHGAGGRLHAGTAYPGVTYNAEVPLLFSEIDPVQNKAVSAAVNTAGFQRDQGLVRPAGRLRQSGLGDL